MKSISKIEKFSIFIHLGLKVRILIPIMGHFPQYSRLYAIFPSKYEYKPERKNGITFEPVVRLRWIFFWNRLIFQVENDSGPKNGVN